jgi:UDP-glucuronate 4-epimerase
MKILITGSAGFVGSALCLRLLELGKFVIGIDNHNDYYDPKIKKARLKRHINHSNYKHYKIDLTNKKGLEKIFKTHKPIYVINLAAQAGVRYSISNPIAYINSNILGFSYLLENCRHYGVKHLIYASSSSVYGANTKVPFSEHDSADHPLSLYAASKRSNELMAHTYSHLFKLPTTGLRFFTVYGPWGRPDMALFKFTNAISLGKSIDVFNYGKHTRDFTYIDDVIEGVVKVIYKVPTANKNWNSSKPDPATGKVPWRIYNIGNNRPIKLMDYINAIEKALGKKAKIKLLPLQSGDVKDTHANINDLKKQFNYKPNTKVTDGIKKFIDWYQDYYKIKKL